MSRIGARTRRTIMGVSDAEATAFVRGTGPKWKHLERAVRHAVGGYHSVLDDHHTNVLIPTLNSVEAPWQGYAYEGAAMGLTGLDLFTPRGHRFADYLAGPAADHAYMVHIGAGEALARLRRHPEPFLSRLPHPVLRWLVMDGYGFHEGFFRPATYVTSQRVPAKLSLYARRVFDQGLGRSFYFSSGADTDEIALTIADFAPSRRADLWLGVGVACGYVGGMTRAEVEQLREMAGPNEVVLAVGAAFVAKGRLRAGNLIEDTQTATQVLCDRSAEEAAALVDASFDALADNTSTCAYDLLQQHLSSLLAPDSQHHSAPRLATL